jgi:peptidyl-prolyl cis-trans isomerase-like 1
MEAPQVQVDTTMGTFTVELYHKHAPNAVENFVELAKRGYYDGTKVERFSFGSGAVWLESGFGWQRTI